MDIKKSTAVAMAQQGKKLPEVAQALGIAPVTLRGKLNRNKMACSGVEDLARYFGLKVSEFIALGE